MDETGADHTVVVADDHESYRKGLARAIDACDGLRLVGQAADGAEALDLITALTPDVALLDVRMPRVDGLEVCRRLQGSGVRTVLLSAYAGDTLDERAREVGAAACLSKESSRSDICETLLTVAVAR